MLALISSYKLQISPSFLFLLADLQLFKITFFEEILKFRQAKPHILQSHVQYPEETLGASGSVVLRTNCYLHY